jgi:hypothetical protein
MIEANEGNSLLDDKDSALVSWVLSHVQDGIDYRNTNFKDKWDEYYRLWRGIWTSEDKTRKSERSRLISPALQQAVEVSVAELEEATFGRGRWFDVSDDLSDQEKRDVAIFRDLMHEDLDEAGVRTAMSEVFLNGALYGTGIGKIVIEEVEDKTIQAVEVYGIQDATVMTAPKIKVSLVPIPPEEFAIDPAARSIEEALYCAHIMPMVPRHSIVKKQEMGAYKEVDLGSFPDDEDTSSKGENKPGMTSDKVKLVEYHGLVPANLLQDSLGPDEEYADLGVEEDDDEDEGMFDYDEDDLVEAIVTIANDSVLLKAVRNPYTMGDRCFVAYQHDTVPNRFYGRGVAEKGYNPQKALDAELRGRMDGMALTIHPMMAMDATRIPRGGDLGVKPGKTILTNGDPRTVLMPFNFGNVNAASFSQSGDLERMIQMGTGSMDSATPVGVSPRNETASGMGMMLAGAIKRSKRTLANIERMFTKPFIKKAAWRFMQFAPDRYPVRDPKFIVHSTLGIMARELEQQQLTGLLQTVPSDSPAFWMLIRSIYEHSSISNREQMIGIVDQMIQKILNPPPPQPDFEQQRKMQELQLKAQNEQARIQVEFIRAQAEMARVKLEVDKAPTEKAKTEAEAMLALAKAEGEKLGSQLDKYKTIADAMKAQSQVMMNDRTGTDQV